MLCKVSFFGGLKAQVKVVGSEAPPGAQEGWCGGDGERPGPAHACPLGLSTHLALPAGSAGHSHSQEGETELNKYSTAVLFGHN